MAKWFHWYSYSGGPHSALKTKAKTTDLMVSGCRWLLHLE